MSLTLKAARQALSKQIGDFWEGTTTSAGNADKLDLIDSTLTGHQSTWVTSGAGGEQPSTVLITDTELNKEERYVDSDNLTTASGTIGVTRAFTVLIPTIKTYEIHKEFTAADKERAIKWTCYDAFPSLYKLIDDSSLRFGDWLRDGGFETWTSSAVLTRWANDTTQANTLAQTSTEFVRTGTYSCKFTGGGSGSFICQGWNQGSATHDTNNIDMQHLAGKTVTFRVWGFSATANALTISLEDGTTSTYGNHTSHSSSTKVYHPGDSTWRLMEVTKTNTANPLAIEARIYNDTTSAVYVDDASLTGIGDKMTYDISDLGLYNHQPNQIYAVSNRAANDTTPRPKDSIVLLDNWSTATSSGLLTFKTRITDGKALRIVGRGYLTQPADAGVNTEASWTSTEVTAPQDEIIVAGAAMYLYRLLISTSQLGDVDRYKMLADYWEKEYRIRKARYGMASLAGTILRG
uniref:Uncharacterized protein n=1 Tax=viral metagenome TaxID=1070528 RepID=A0A6H1ZGM3_9ZZZZ